MKAFYLFVLIAFLMYGINFADGGADEILSDESGMTTEMPEGYAASVHGYLESTISVFQPDLKGEDMSGEDSSIAVHEFFPDCKDCGPAEFTFQYRPEEGVRVFASWNTIGYDLAPEMGEMEKEFLKGELGEDAAWYMTTADLDKDGIPELLVALYDGVIDGTLKVFKMYNYEKEDPQQMTLREEGVGEIWFQNEVYIEKNGHIIVTIGSQGLYEEYAMKDGKLELIYSPSTSSGVIYDRRG